MYMYVGKYYIYYIYMSAFGELLLPVSQRVQMSEWLLFNANWAIFSYIKARTVNFQWEDDEVRFVINQHV